MELEPSPPTSPLPPRTGWLHGLRGRLPTGNRAAAWGYYLGVFSLIPGIGLLLGPAAIVTGAIGLAHARRVGAGRSHARAALVLGGLTSLLHGAVLLWSLAHRLG